MAMSKTYIGMVIMTVTRFAHFGAKYLQLQEFHFSIICIQIIKYVPADVVRLVT